MTTPAQDAPLVFPSVAFRPLRLFAVCVVLTGLATLAAGLLGHVMVGVFFGVGLGLGLLNAVLVQRSVEAITADAHPLKRKMALNSATRLLVMTVIGLTIAFIFRPQGLGVVFGMALFQVVLVISTALPVMKKIRAGAAAGPSSRLDSKGRPHSNDRDVLAEAAIEVGHHETAKWFGLTVNTDTVLATAIAAVIVIALAFFLRAKVTSTGVPGGVQLFWEAITVQLRDQIETAIGMKIAPFVLPLAVTLFVFILVANWLSVLPVQYTDGTGATHELLKPPASDINFVLALALFVFICYHAAGIWRRGIIGHPVKLLKGHVAFLAPINLVEELAKPISLSLRLFGNMFAGGILVALIALFPPWILWLPNAIWKSFDLFVGAIQAFIFALLTILYFSQSMELDEDHH